MRHRKTINHLGRMSSHRKAMLSNMASSLILHKRINTTLAKAKALRGYVEPLITKSRTDSTHSRRVVFSYLQNKEAVSELFREIAIKIGDRPGGYTRILKTGNRLGDNAEKCLMELVDYNDTLLVQKEEKKTKTTRRRGSGKKKTEGSAQDKAVEPVSDGDSVETPDKGKIQKEIKAKKETEVKSVKEKPEDKKEEDKQDDNTEKQAKE
jgi:large subunit ribosomal protein L17